ncbi:MFS transporter [Mycobacterium sp. 1423905.2]|uniref:MFS transporter n=1 Tax=Mycobacterium sp. 1423905.2 TaxID=1856859 RepID=UPI000801C46F|nr:MFS transporter [Mycobacterium sp. 1423905.2]OBJ50124.1 hypothetical protein A9W95_24595 [Mycobacterium sp. 1423905.2]
MTTARAIAVQNRVLNTQLPAATDARYPAVLWLLLGGNLLVRAAGFGYPFLAYHVAGHSHAAGAVGAVMAAYGVGWSIGQLLCGWLVDRIGARATLVGAMSVAAAALISMADATSVLALLAGAVIAGLATDAPRPVLGSAITELVSDPQQRAKLDAWRHGWVLNIGAAIAGGLGGLLAAAAGTALLYWLNALACAAFAIVAGVCMPASIRRVTPHVSGKCGYRQVLSDYRLLLLVVSALATLTALMGFFAAVPMLMCDSGLGAGDYGWVQVANGIAVITITPVMTRWLSKRLARAPRLDILAAAGVWTTLCMGAAGLAHTTLVFSAAAAACAPGEIAWFVAGAGVVHRIAPLANSGRYHGIWSMTTAAASVVAPILASWSMNHGGRPVVALTTVTVGLFGAVLCSPLARVLSCVTGMAPQ